jgi:hypothetical protein
MRPRLVVLALSALFVFAPAIGRADCTAVKCAPARATADEISQYAYDGATLKWLFEMSGDCETGSASRSPEENPIELAVRSTEALITAASQGSAAAGTELVRRRANWRRLERLSGGILDARVAVPGGGGDADQIRVAVREIFTGEVPELLRRARAARRGTLVDGLATVAGELLGGGAAYAAELIRLGRVPTPKLLALARRAHSIWLPGHGEGFDGQWQPCNPDVSVRSAVDRAIVEERALLSRDPSAQVHPP